MTEMTAGSVTETTLKKGSRLLGCLGAFWGALVGAGAWYALMFLTPQGEFWKLTILGAAAVSWCACRGYRLLRGYRSMRFARWTVRACTVLAQPVVLVGSLALRDLWRRYGTLRIPLNVFFLTVVQVADGILSDRETLLFLGQLALLSLLFSALGWTYLMKYVDPQWAKDPWRSAQMGNNGATFNTPPCWPLPIPEQIPERFQVDKGKLSVEGETITVKGWGKSRHFSVYDVAGVVLGASNGYNVLYDREEQILARFAWSRKNGVLFGQYLLQNQIPFLDCDQSPVDTQAPEEQKVPRQFTVREGRLNLALGWIGLIFFGSLLAMDIFLLDGLERLVCGAVFLVFTGMGGWTILSCHRRQLEVDGDALTYTSTLGRVLQFRLSDVADVTCSANNIKMRDREGKVLARFENNPSTCNLLIAYWNQYKRERTKTYEQSHCDH